MKERTELRLGFTAFVLVAILIAMFSGCTVLEQFAADKAEAVWDVVTEAPNADEKPIDSIRVYARHYWVERVDTVFQDTDYEVGEGALRGWYLETEEKRRNEMIFDSVIYIWRK